MIVAEGKISELGSEGYGNICHVVARDVSMMRLDGRKDAYVSMLEKNLDNGIPVLRLPFYLDDFGD